MNEYLKKSLPSVLLALLLIIGAYNIGAARGHFEGVIEYETALNSDKSQITECNWSGCFLSTPLSEDSIWVRCNIQNACTTQPMTEEIRKEILKEGEDLERLYKSLPAPVTN